MERSKSIGHGRKGKHLTREERVGRLMWRRGVERLVPRRGGGFSSHYGRAGGPTLPAMAGMVGLAVPAGRVRVRRPSSRRYAEASCLPVPPPQPHNDCRKASR